jgi:hypothetical protein
MTDINKKINEKVIKELFENFKNTDADYLIIFFNYGKPWVYSLVPSDNPFGICVWETIDEALAYPRNIWDTAEIYDLYAPSVEDSFLRRIINKNANIK